MMNSAQIEIQLVAAVVAVACALPGVFLVLRRMALMSDAISHSILLGIVLAFFLTSDLTSPLLIVAAALTGLFTVFLVEILNRSRLVREDTAIGLVFPVLFSAGVILISRYAGNVHLDTDAVLLGELAFAPFDRLLLFGHDLGPRSLYLMGGILIFDLAFIVVFYKELKIATFDASLAAVLGFSPVLIHYALMGFVSLTAVGAFDAVGSILVVALMIAPPSAAYLLTDRLSLLLVLSASIGVASAITGYWAAHFLDVSIAGSMATAAGGIFCAVLILAPGRGLMAKARRRSRQRWEFALQMLAVHLAHHEGRPEEARENRTDHLHEHIRWDPAFARRVVRYGERKQAVVSRSGDLELTDRGREIAGSAVTT